MKTQIIIIEQSHCTSSDESKKKYQLNKIQIAIALVCVCVCAHLYIYDVNNCEI